MLTYDEALDYLYSFVDYSATMQVRYSAQAFDLSRMTALLRLMGNPQNRYPTVHLAGTKGKGSVAAMCASVLRSAGYRTGFYTSPHLQDYCERIQINGQLISPQALAAGVERLQTLTPQVPGVTTFELTTALAFDYFAREGVDLAVIEVGLGGRLDATNVITPLVTVITSLSYDHMDLLGHTLTAIAGEKAGIFKTGVPAVSAPQVPEARAALERAALERGVALSLVGREWRYRPVAHSLDSQTFDIQQADGAATRLEIPLLGAHQVENAATAYAALAALRDRGLPISDAAIRAGLRSVRWPGRFEILQRGPFLVADGAHNRDSAHRLAAALDDYFPGRRVILIYGASADKDITGMLDELRPRCAHVIFSQAVHPRAAEPEALLALAAAWEEAPPLETRAPVAAALARARALAGPEDVILACGSLFIVAEVRAAQSVVLAHS